MPAREGFQEGFTVELAEALSRLETAARTARAHYAAAAAANVRMWSMLLPAT